MSLIEHPIQLLNLLQLASPTLPIGAYSYSDGLETLIEQKIITNQSELTQWLITSLNYGSIKIDTALMMRSHLATINKDQASIIYWNNWQSASTPTQEIRQSSWQMGSSLANLIQNITPDIKPLFSSLKNPINLSIAFGITTAYHKIPINTSILAYIHTWISHQISVAVKIVPLGQTQGQQILIDLQPDIIQNTQIIINLTDDQLSCFNWSQTLASMAHTNQYTRLFRS